jgi:hypothetical protein
MRLAAMPLALIALMAPMALAGCAQYDAERAANLQATAQAQTAADDANCQAAGVKPGTPAYDDCRRRYANQHAQTTHRQENLANEMLNAQKIGPIGQ